MKITKSPRFIFLEHTADIKFQAFANNLEDLFKHCAFAVSYSMCEEKIEKTKIKKIKVSGKDLENLLYKFLEEIVYLFDSENLVLEDVKALKIDRDKFSLIAEVSFGDSRKYEIKQHVKSVTYHEMFVKQENGKWVAQVVLDV